MFRRGGLQWVFGDLTILQLHVRGLGFMFRIGGLQWGLEGLALLQLLSLEVSSEGWVPIQDAAGVPPRVYDPGPNARMEVPAWPSERSPNLNDNGAILVGHVLCCSQGTLFFHRSPNP